MTAYRRGRIIDASSGDRQKLFSLESAAGFDEGMDRKVQADDGEDRFNRGALVIGKVVFVVLAHQRRRAQAP